MLRQGSEVVHHLLSMSIWANDDLIKDASVASELHFRDPVWPDNQPIVAIAAIDIVEELFEDDDIDSLAWLPYALAPELGIPATHHFPYGPTIEMI